MTLSYPGSEDVCRFGGPQVDSSWLVAFNPHFLAPQYGFWLNGIPTVAAAWLLDTKLGWIGTHTHTNMSWLCWLAQTRQICIEYSPKWLVNIWGMGSESWYGSNSFAEFLISCWASKLLWSPVAWPRTLDWVAPTQSSRSFWRTPSGMTWLKVVSRWLRMTPMTPQFLVLKC